MFVNKYMPKKRPMDNVVMSPMLPQEEEFALANSMPYSYYLFWFFPKQTMELCNKYLLFEGLPDEDFNEWKRIYMAFVKRAMINTGGSQFLSKNPPHTARIKALLEIFPNAKFIFLTRNPFTVFESTMKFMWYTVQMLKLQDFTYQELEKNVLEVYRLIHNKYEKEKVLVPRSNLIEIRFEDFEENSLEMLEEIYTRLRISNFNVTLPSFENYLSSMKGYKKNKYDYSDRTLKIVKEHWGSIAKQNYM